MATALEMLKAAAPAISVGVMAANPLALGADLALLDTTDIRLLHFDVMDGCFIPMMTAGPSLIKAVKTPLLKDVHLMVEEPLEKLADYVTAGADMLTVHVESARHIHRVLQAMGNMTNANDPERGLVRGIALNPGTPLEALAPLLDLVDFVMLLAINPGWGGQGYLPSTNERLAAVCAMIAGSGREILLGVDGGITRANIAAVARTGVDVVVAGSAIYDGKAPIDNARFMQEALRGA